MSELTLASTNIVTKLFSTSNYLSILTLKKTHLYYLHFTHSSLKGQELCVTISPLQIHYLFSRKLSPDLTLPIQLYHLVCNSLFKAQFW